MSMVSTKALMLGTLLLALLCLGVLGQEVTKGLNYNKLTFGSCFRHQIQYKDSEILRRIIQEKAGTYAWLGDFAYLDIIHTWPKVHFEYNSLEVIKQKFKDSYEDPEYVPLRTGGTKIVGVWDDHDSGINNSDQTNHLKEEIRQMFLDHVDEPKNSPRRTQKGGMYGSYYLDLAKQIKLILLDNRYSRDGPQDKSKPQSEKCVFGAEQLAWLQKEVEGSTAQFTLIANGNQLLPDDRPIVEEFYQKTRDFVLTLFNPKTNIILLSGDVHNGEIMTDQCTKFINGYEMREFTSSGMTHSVDSVTGALGDTVLDFLYPDTYNTVEDRFMKENYGVVEFELDNLNPSRSNVTVNIKDYWGRSRLHWKLNVEQDFPKRTKLDIEAYKKCVEAKGSPNTRFYSNLRKKALNPKHGAFYIIMTLALTTLIVLYVLWRLLWCLLNKLYCMMKNKKTGDKVKGD